MRGALNMIEPSPRGKPAKGGSIGDKPLLELKNDAAMEGV
jgi:hypothetical protein